MIINMSIYKSIIFFYKTNNLSIINKSKILFEKIKLLIIKLRL